MASSFDHRASFSPLKLYGKELVRLSATKTTPDIPAFNVTLAQHFCILGIYKKGGWGETAEPHPSPTVGVSYMPRNPRGFTKPRIVYVLGLKKNNIPSTRRGNVIDETEKRGRFHSQKAVNLPTLLQKSSPLTWRTPLLHSGCGGCGGLFNRPQGTRNHSFRPRDLIAEGLTYCVFPKSFSVVRYGRPFEGFGFRIKEVVYAPRRRLVTVVEIDGCRCRYSPFGGSLFPVGKDFASVLRNLCGIFRKSFHGRQSHKGP